MRRLEFLINQVRSSTDNVDTNGISNAEIIGYFNDAQRYIESIIFKNNPDADLFKAQIELQTNLENEYELPEDIFAVNAISMVEVRMFDTSNNGGFVRIKPISESEFSYIFGYITRNSKILISGQKDAMPMRSIRITYFKRLPTLDIRRAKVSSILPEVSITMDSTPTEMYSMDDHASTVDVSGDQVISNIRFTNTSGNVLLTANTEGVDNTQYIVSGKDSANRSPLPDICETYLLDYVRQRIYTRNNYEDAGKQSYFTEKQQAQIVSIFSRNKKDDNPIPITDLGYLTF